MKTKSISLKKAKKKPSRPFFFYYAIFLFLMLLLQPAQMLLLGKESLLLWYETLLPVLFPAMIASNLFLYYFTQHPFPSCFTRIVKKLYALNGNGFFVIFLGFLAGFPMGSYLTGKLLREGRLSKRDGIHLLSFCNNIGPVYFFTVFLRNYNLSVKLLCGLMFYGIPLCYGFFLRLLKSSKQEAIASVLSVSSENKNNTKLSGEEILDYAINDALSSIVRLCGYLICFRALLLIPKYYIPSFFGKVFGYGLVEVTSFVQLLQETDLSANHYLLWGMTALTLGGFCGIAQTACMLKNTGLSLKTYALHKAAQTILLYGIASFLLPQFL